MNTSNKVFLVLGTIAIVGAAAWSGYTLFVTPDTTTRSTVQSVTNNRSNSARNSGAAGNATTVTYKNGTYKAGIDYYVPHGTNTLTATVTIADGIITSVSASNNYSDGESAIFIDSFESGISSAATGQPLNTVSLSRVGGASLTTQAFDSVLDTIRSQAAA